MIIYLLVIEMLHSNTRRADKGSVRVVKTLEQIAGFHCHTALSVRLIDAVGLSLEYYVF